MARKIVFVIVEGPSDDDALGVLLDKIYDKNTVYIHITHCDITLADYTDVSQVLRKITELVRTYAKNNHLTKIHFKEIIHIIDTDGVYIPDEAVIFDSTAEKPIYTLTNILTNKVEKIRERNQRKRQCLNKIAIQDTLWGIPYQAYYMSCNLDHALYGKMNSSDEEKEEDSLAFAQKYRDDIEGFIQFICESDFSIMGDYRESWKYIQQEGLYSLQRYTNLGICIMKAINNEESEETDKL